MKLTEGRVSRTLWRYALPILGANILQTLYSIADMVVVGRMVGSAGLAAVSNAAMLSFIIGSICSGITAGGSVLVAQYKGAEDGRGQAETIGTLFILSAAAAAAVTLLALIGYPQIFKWMSVPEEAMGYAQDYMQMIALGTVFVFGYNAVCSVMRGLGDSKSPLLFVAIATAVNILLDILLVGPLDMGTRGAGLATVAAQAVSFAAAVPYMKRRDFPFDFRRRSFKIRWDKGKTILRIGLPTAVQMSAVNLSYLIVTAMLNVYGVTVAAAAGAGLKINTYAALPCWAVGQAVTTMVGQSMGAGNGARARRTVWTGVWLSEAVSLIMVAAVQIFAREILSLFGLDSAGIEEGVRYLRICCSVNFAAYAAMYIFDAFATGVGASLFAMANALLQAVVIRLSLSWLLGTVLSFGHLGIYYSEALSPIVPCIAGLIFLRTGCWNRTLIPSGGNPEFDKGPLGEI
ncbi:MATE family efflux transporter [Gehongia tenuis]|uniref:Probable multidrug resistance protein NorM n=1 Tax=Gehongia tenuis TaxID=2763655 RepID=A0A926D4M5_9FIRM|nr:MATE family efflux transporter [Gehongia tenuis]MBC8531638.1 MATE family efflux transporter [Gehongia tenuis]